jgi:hypothetical protein
MENCFYIGNVENGWGPVLPLHVKPKGLSVNYGVIEINVL